MIRAGKSADNLNKIIPDTDKICKIGTKNLLRNNHYLNSHPYSHVRLHTPRV